METAFSLSSLINYLSHYVLDAWREDAFFSVGGALPDLCRMRGAGFRLKPGGLQPRPNDALASVEAGIAAHYAADAAWHGSTRFAGLAAIVKQAFLEANVGLVRTSFAAHIGTEMLLDRALLTLRPELASAFYACFTQEALQASTDLLAEKGLGHWQPRFTAEWKRFTTRRFLARYPDVPYMAGTWHGIYTHVTGDMVAQPAEVWETLVEPITKALQPAAKELLAQGWAWLGVRP